MKVLLATRSIRTRVVIAAGILILATAAFITTASILVIEHGLESIMSDRQSSLIDQVASDIDRQLALRKAALSRLAADMTVIHNTQSEQLQKVLEQYHSLDGLFSNLSVFNAQGEQLANMNIPDSRGKFNASNRDYFKQTVQTRAPVLSQPIRSVLSGRPLVIITAPIFDTNDTPLCQDSCRAT